MSVQNISHDSHLHPLKIHFPANKIRQGGHAATLASPEVTEGPSGGYYDGTTLTWASGRSDRFGLDQAERNARSVAEWLTAATGEAVT